MSMVHEFLDNIQEDIDKRGLKVSDILPLFIVVLFIPLMIIVDIGNFKIIEAKKHGK